MNPALRYPNGTTIAVTFSNGETIAGRVATQDHDSMDITITSEDHEDCGDVFTLYDIEQRTGRASIVATSESDRATAREVA